MPSIDGQNENTATCYWCSRSPADGCSHCSGTGYLPKKENTGPRCGHCGYKFPELHAWRNCINCNNKVTPTLGGSY